MKIAILDDYQDVVRHLSCFSLLEDHDVKIFGHGAVGMGQLAIRLAPYEALVLIRERTIMSGPLLTKLPNLKLISQTGRVSGTIDLIAAKKLGVTVMEGGGDPTAPAELTWALIMASSRKIVAYTTNLQNQLWQTASIYPHFNQLGCVLKGKQLGIWGYGKIGQLVAGYGKAFGMQVTIWGSTASQKRALHDGFQVSNSRSEFFATSDIISLHLRLNEFTHSIVNEDDLRRMKTDALLVNISRAELIAPDALLNSMQVGTPGFAALDVFENEPLPANSPLRNRENVLLTPHIGFVERESYELYFRQAFQNILNFVDQPH